MASDPADPELLALLYEHGGDLRAAWPARRTVTALVVFVVADFATYVTSSWLRTSDISPSVRLLIVSLILYGALVAAAVYFYRQDGRLRFRDAYGLSFRWSDIAWGFVVSIIARIAASLVILPIYLFDRDWVGTNVPDGDRLHGTWVLVAIAVAAVVFAPIVEELYFRGYLLPRMERMGRWAPLVNVTLFSLYHFWSPWQVMARIVGLGPTVYAVRWKRNVYLGMIVHGALNVISVLIVVALVSSRI
ncbi:MAG: CPBP family intramembrane glutamic endopeptidase [Chloroflexota bacterium]